MRAAIEGVREPFCCYGCILALQITRARGEHGAAAVILIRLGLAIFFSMNVMMVSMPTYAPYIYGADAVPTDGALFQVLRVLALVFTAPVLFLLGGPILTSALQAMRRGAPNTDALIVVGTGAAYALSVVNTVGREGAVYFDTAAMLLVLVTLGRYLEARARAEAGAAVGAHLAPAPALATRMVGPCENLPRSETVDKLPPRPRIDAAPFDKEGSRGICPNGSPANSPLTPGHVEHVSPDALVPDDVVRVAPGEAFPADGVVLDGVGGVDESALTGESRPVVKEPGSPVASGASSIDGLFLVRVTARAAESAAARIAALLDAARRERARAERLADRVAAVMVPAVITVAALAAGFWALRAGPDRGILVGLAVLVVACPCGLGIATPVAVWTGLVTAARRGVIIRSAAVLERTGAIEHVFFDKTGTLTERTPRLVAIEPAPGSALSRRELLQIAAALEAGLTHPLARAIAAAWKEEQEARPRGWGSTTEGSIGTAEVPAPASPAGEACRAPSRSGEGEGSFGISGSGRGILARARCRAGEGAEAAREEEREAVEGSRGHGSEGAIGVQVIPGRGVRGRVNGEPVSAGSLRFAAEELGVDCAALQARAAGDATAVFVWRARRLLGTLRFAEAPRPEAAPALAALRALGVRVGLLTGDRQAAALVPALIAPPDAEVGLLPEEKVARLRVCRARGGAAMVGDGINDAPALAAADLGIAVGDATDLTRMTADIAVVGDDLRRVPWVIGYARRVRRVIRQNLFWVFAYNAGALAIAAAGALNPLIASAAMIANSFLVVANASRLRAG